MARYPELAALIVAGRNRLGLSQSELAAELDLKQQAVSRWEAATHRPAVEQIPSLASLLGEGGSKLMRLAGYGNASNAAISTLLPLDTLDPETFERFTEFLVAELHPEAEVNIQGARGHAQAGTDILARFPDGRQWSFQCKRVERFGRAEIEKAVAYHDVDAEKKFLVLSKIASPASIETLASHEGWALWDKQVLTRKLRGLPIEVQERIVDIFFRGQRMALLGREEPGPWLTPEEYFAPFKGRGAIFSHDWSLVGRAETLHALGDLLDADDEQFVLLVGPGGTGKTRVLKEAIVQYARESPGIAIRFLSASQDPDALSLGKLGNGRKLLVVDDAHDRDGLKLLVEYVLDERNKAKLLIATRPYGEQRIRNELALYRIVEPGTVNIGRLDKASLGELVTQVLKEFRGDADWVDPIIRAASDSPLVAAMAARVVALDGKIPELARGEATLRRVILSRFTSVTTGQLGSPSDTALLRSVLEVLALIQPFHIDDRGVAELVAINRPGLAPTEVSRALKLLLEGGVIYRRGTLYRLMPDLLGDFLIEDCCIGADRRLAEFAIEMARESSGDRLVHILVNLGRTDWRLADGDTSNSRLLDPIWYDLQQIDNEYDGRISAVEAVAYYQPAQALDFVQRQLSHGRVFPEFGRILERVAYSSDHRADALRLLWDLGQRNDHDLNSDTGHPIRLLSELIGYDQYKPVSFNEEVSEFGFSLIDEPSAWGGKYTPFDILKPILSGEGMATRSTGRGISMSSYFIAYDVVAGLRARLIDQIIGMLEDENSRKAVLAAHMISDAIRSPHGMFNAVVPLDLLAKYEAEFARTIARVGDLIKGGNLAPTTVIVLIKSLRWFSEYGTGPLHEQVCEVFRHLPTDIGFRLHAAMTEGADWDFVGQIPFIEWIEDKDWQGDFIGELLEAYPDRSELLDVLMETIARVEASGLSVFASFELVGKLVEREQTMRTLVVERSMADPSGRPCNYVGFAVSNLLDEEPEQGRKTIRQMLASTHSRLRTGGVRALIGLKRLEDSDQLALIGEALQASDLEVVSIALTALRTHRELSERQIIALLLQVDFQGRTALFENIAAVFCMRRAHIIAQLRTSEASALFERMKKLPALEGHWTHELLKATGEHHSVLLAQFILDRLDLMLLRNDDEGYAALPGPGRNGGLSLEKTPEAERVLERIWQWLREHDQLAGWTRYSIGNSIAAMVRLDSDPVVDYLERLLARATTSDLVWIGDLLRHGHHRFALNRRRFVERYLDRCRATEPKLWERSVDKLEAAALSGGWSGTVGEPMPRDIKARDDAAAILATMSRLSPAYTLYDTILKDSKRRIEQSLAEGAALDDEER